MKKINLEKVPLWVFWFIFSITISEALHVSATVVGRMLNWLARGDNFTHTWFHSTPRIQKTKSGNVCWT